jgi:glutamate synthase domain-containing protein 3
MIIVEGDIRDIAGYAMRGGKIWVKGDVSYRVGIHMKSYLDDYPVTMIGGSSRDFLGEYMAGGLIVVLGLGYDSNCSPVGKFIASGMNGGKLFIRGRFQPEQAGPGIGIEKPTPEDFDEINLYLQEFSTDLSLEIPELKCDDFVKVFPTTTRPYGRVYAY